MYRHLAKYVKKDKRICFGIVEVVCKRLNAHILLTTDHLYSSYKDEADDIHFTNSYLFTRRNICLKNCKSYGILS